MPDGPQFVLPTGKVNNVLPILETGPFTKLTLLTPVIKAVALNVKIGCCCFNKARSKGKHSGKRNRRI